jgi:tetratricopeptide (TPR) repeat protein
LIARSAYETSVGTLTVEDSMESALKALALFEEAGDELHAGAAESWLIMPTFQQGRQEEALEHGRRSIARLEPFGDTRELAHSLRQLGQFHWRRGELEEADVALRRAEAMAGRVGARDIRAQAMQDLGVSLSMGGDPDAIATLEEAFVLAKEVGERLNLQRIYNNYASTLFQFGSEFTRAREVASEGVELGRRIGGMGWLAWIVGTRAEIDLALGDLAAAETGNREALEMALEAHDESLIALRYPIMAQTLLLLGRIDEAEAALAQAHELLGDDEEPQGEIPRSWTEGLLALVRGRREDAFAHLRHGTALAQRYSVDTVPQVLLELVRLCLDSGEREEAEALRASLGTAVSPLGQACADAAAGLLASDDADAIERLHAAADRFERIGARIELARTLLDLGRAERRAGLDPRPTFARARELLVACDARFFLPEVDAELENV